MRADKSPANNKPIVQLSAAADPQFLKAFSEIAARIAGPLAPLERKQLPVKMFLAGGAAVHIYTGARSTGDVDAVFSKRVLLPDDLDVNYVDAKGENRLLYFDRQYNDTFGLLHEDAQDDSVPIAILGVDPKVLEVRLLRPVDLAVSKIARFEEHDQRDLESLAREGLITAAEVRRRADEALSGYVGNVERVKTSIELACQLIAAASPSSPAAPHKPPRTRRDK
jgi:hypothetical protein